MYLSYIVKLDKQTFAAFRNLFSDIFANISD